MDSGHGVQGVDHVREVRQGAGEKEEVEAGVGVAPPRREKAPPAGTELGEGVTQFCSGQRPSFGCQHALILSEELGAKSAVRDQIRYLGPVPRPLRRLQGKAVERWSEGQGGQGAVEAKRLVEGLGEGLSGQSGGLGQSGVESGGGAERGIKGTGEFVQIRGQDRIQAAEGEGVLVDGMAIGDVPLEVFNERCFLRGLFCAPGFGRDAENRKGQTLQTRAGVEQVAVGRAW